MTRSCVRQLDLRLSLPGELRSQSSQIADELKRGFITRVVETIEQRLHASFGADAIIEIPVLTVKLEGEKKRFYDWDYAVQAGEDIASELLMQWQGKPRTERLQPVHDGGVKYYECNAHKQAQQLQLLAEACQRHANAWDVTELQQQWHKVCSETDAILQQVLEYSDEMTSLKLVVNTLSFEDIQLAIRVLPVSRWPSSIQTTVYKRLARENHENNATNYEASQPTDVSQTTSTDAPDQHATESTNLNQETEPGQKTSTKISHDTMEPPPSATPPGNNIYPLNTNKKSSETEQKAQALSSNADLLLDGAAKDGSLNNPLINDQLNIDTVAINSFNATMGVENNPQSELGGLAYYKTAYGGLFYVLNLLLRIELPEILWCAAIDEKSFLFDLMAAMTGEEGKQDPVLHIVSGIHFDKKNYKPSKIPSWAWEEVLRKVYRNIDDCLTKNSQTKFHLCYSDTDIEKIINTQKSENKDAWISLVDICHGLVSTAFLCVLSPDDSGHTFLNHIKTQGVIKESDEEVSVEFTMEAIDIDIRRAALDINPGYLAWLCRHLDIYFIES